jgi:hypothetical protein
MLRDAVAQSTSIDDAHTTYNYVRSYMCAIWNQVCPEGATLAEKIAFKKMQKQLAAMERMVMFTYVNLKTHAISSDCLAGRPTRRR